MLHQARVLPFLDPCKGCFVGLRKQGVRLLRGCVFSATFMKMEYMEHSGIEIYQVEGGKTEIAVVLDKDTVWLSMIQMVELFQRDKSVISRHVRNIFSDRELDKEAVVAKNATTASDGKTYLVEYYNLDVIISVGYRIKSQRGTQFRIWANKILKDYLIKGYSINEMRIKEQNRQLKSLQQTVKLLGSVLDYRKISGEEGEGLLKIISDYAYGLDILDQYDYQTLAIVETSGKETYHLTYDEVIMQINKVKIYFGSSWGDYTAEYSDEYVLTVP